MLLAVFDGAKGADQIRKDDTDKHWVCHWYADKHQTRQSSRTFLGLLSRPALACSDKGNRNE